ncbi:hypothetical protein BS50DRAFT_573649 [Corynespora cassiicola Philippines]|uniref:Ribonuclease H2 subunit B n=1 Tax=Corynespora cassiicola Philippines TaxID=1448308 RepID=A0A2T2NN47_CORCC|nr:hypothetical protein BS50DRAFT_573649 [Corynespora cassiicola Philippines]
MARTRSKPAAEETTPAETAPEETTSSQAKSLSPSAENPPKLFVLPKDTSKDARIVTLDNPANGTPSRYFFCPEKGFYEFTRIAAPKKACKSWLITPEASEEEEETENTEDSSRIGNGYVAKSPDLFVATPIDLLFLILPALAPKTTKDTKQHFLAFDDHLDMLSNTSRHWKALLSSHPSLRQVIEKKMASVSDTVDAGDEVMYRLSHDKLLALLLKKAHRMVKNGLPASIEEKFVKSALDIPIMNIRREPSDSAEPSTSQDASQAGDSQTVTADPEPTLTTPPTIPPLLRLRLALNYMTISYVPSTLRAPLTALLGSSSAAPDLKPLDAHLSAIAKIKSEAAALRSISDNISRKRGFEEDEDKIAEREEKKRKKEEEDKKKKSENRSIKQLKKVDTSGMKKLSAFFTKAPAKK